MCPGASSTVYLFFSVSKCARPTSTVLPLALSSSLVSMMYAMYQDSRFLSFASASYFWMVRSSTMPAWKRI